MHVGGAEQPDEKEDNRGLLAVPLQFPVSKPD